jgi:hypothetical protein
MAENQTKAQVILEANTATFMTQIRSVATQARSIFNRVFSAIRLPGLLSIGGLVAGSVALPTTGRTIGEAVQMQRLHGQLDRLNATLVAELAPIRMLVLKILIALLGGLNATARFFNQLIEKFPELGNFAKGLATIVVMFFALRYTILGLKLFGNRLGKLAWSLASVIFKAVGQTSGYQLLKAKKYNPFAALSLSLRILFSDLVKKIEVYRRLLGIFFRKNIPIKLNIFDPVKDIFKYIDKIFYEFSLAFAGIGNLNRFLDALLGPIFLFGRLITTASMFLMTFLNFLISALVSGAVALGGIIASFIGGLVAVFGVFGTIALAVAVIMGVISVIYLLVVGFDYIIAALKWFGLMLWNVGAWIVKMLYFIGALIVMIFGFIGKRFLDILASIGQIFYNAFAFVGKILYSVFAFIGKILLNVFIFIGKMLLAGLGWVIKNLIIAPIAALGKWVWDTISSLFSNITDWFSSLFETPPFTIQGTGSFGGFSKEELELASPKMPELVTIGTTVVNLLDQIKKLIEQQRSAAVRRVSGVI